MGEAYIAKTFKSGNSVALRLPKALGLSEGAEMRIREEHGRLVVEPIEREPRRIDLTGVYGSIPDLERLPIDDAERDWSGDSVRA